MSRETRVIKEEKQEALDHLRKILIPGDKVYGVVKHVSRSGMTRHIDFYAFKPHHYKGDEVPTGEVDRIYLTGWIAQALDMRRTKEGALVVGGCGMDMVFHIVYNLSRRLFPDGFGVQCEKCGFRASQPEETYRTHCPLASINDVTGAHRFFGRNGDRTGWDTDGGYALKHDHL